MNNWYKNYKLAFSNPLDILAREIVDYLIRNFQLRTIILTEEEVPGLINFGLSRIIFRIGRFVNNSQSQVYPINITGGYVHDDANEDYYISAELDILYNPNNNIPITNYYAEIYQRAREFVRHEIEHRDNIIKGKVVLPESNESNITNNSFNKFNSIDFAKMQLENNFRHISDPIEIDPIIRGSVNLSKQRKEYIYPHLERELWERLIYNVDMELIKSNSNTGHNYIKEVNEKYTKILQIYKDRLTQIYQNVYYTGI